MKNPERQLILNETQRVRDGVQEHRHAPFARHMLRIPIQDFQALLQLFPLLGSDDPAESAAAWDAFEQSPFSEPYRVGRISRGIIRNGVIRK